MLLFGGGFRPLTGIMIFIEHKERFEKRKGELSFRPLTGIMIFN